MIKETDASGTARTEKANDTQRGKSHSERAHIDLSRGKDEADKVGVKVSTKAKSAVKKTVSDETSVKTKASSQAKTEEVVKKSPRISRFASSDTESKSEESKKTSKKSTNSAAKASKVIKVESEDKVKSSAKSAATKSKSTIKVKSTDDKDSNKAKTDGKTKKSTATKVAVLESENALANNRAASMEKPKAEITKVSKGKAISGLVVEKIQPRKRATIAKTIRTTQQSANAKPKATSEPEPELRFSKAKSMLIGVGVAVAVAIVGFAGIAIFGNNKKMCTVHFESNGGTQVEGAEIVCGRAITQPEDPEKEGFSFEGWVLDGDPFDFEINSINKNATLVAKWKANEGTKVVVVSFDTDGGSEMKDIEIAKGTRLNMPTSPTKMGYIFDEWYYDGKPFDFTKTVDKDITLKAKWERRSESSSGSSSSNSNSNNTYKPNNQVTSLTIKNMSVVSGKGTSMNVAVYPSAADYSLSVVANSNSDVANCYMAAKNIITCDGKKPGTSTIQVRDANSGYRTMFTVTVTSDTPVTSGGQQPEEEPKPSENPGKPSDKDDNNPTTPPTNPPDPGNNDNNGGDDNNSGDNGDNTDPGNSGDNGGGDNNNNSGDNNGDNGDNTGNGDDSGNGETVE